MADYSCILISGLLLFLLLQSSQSESNVKNSNNNNYKNNNVVKTEVFLSPKFVLAPGLVSNKYYYNIDFPRGHIAIKSFNAEIVDENGNPIPLHETYLHHWVLQRYYHQINGSDFILVKNSGLCGTGLTQYFGLGAETRKTETHIPDPYGIEAGGNIPAAGYEEGWFLNVHAIDTRGAHDRLACTECGCDLYNVTVDEYGVTVPREYKGGVRCCHDGTRCPVREGIFFSGVAERSLYLRYTVKYVEWNPLIVPVKIYILDVSDVWTTVDGSRGSAETHNCVVEYDIEPCPNSVANDGCVHTKTLSASLPSGGDVIYGVGHQHAGATGIALYGEGGRLICWSNPIYGTGEEAGNEAGYVVGMSTCYPTPGSLKISSGEKLTLVSNYSNAQSHTGVMGFFYLLIADSSPKSNPLRLYAPSDEVWKNAKLSDFVWPIVVLGVVVVAAVVVFVVLKGRSGRGEDYEAML
ncbi:PREDICTED: uncharacterized protein LOC105972452 [Erythranthe guttata]|uniref:uncharacterized protein LOC105972452 n=1 Tax=Erythranthe guttata TaxID=4155 RepID=UPI00064E12E4|nr:PREDICTED: uncharacterized protein LOC105972452 [Erythranthe guttata]|eukprot:XP_012852868.1 PREDICTED: uncharacterized protein LOC105972452 [Erythranthe guttata]